MARSSSFSKQQIIVLLVCVGIFALGQFHRASGAVFTPILMDRFTLSAASIAGLVSVMYFANILVQVPFGAALDRIGPRPVLTVCVLLIAFGTVLFAFGPGFEALFVSRTLIGIGMAAMSAATHVIIARNFAARDFGYISGLVVTLGGIGGLLGTYPLAFALERAPWPVVFSGAALAAFVLAGAVLRAVEPGVRVKAQGAEAGGFLTLLRNAEFLKILALGFVTYGPITTITGLWGGPYLQDVAGFSADGAGAVLLVLFCASIFGAAAFGQMDRHFASRKRVILGAVLASSVSLAVLAGVPGLPVSLVIGLLLIAVFAQQFFIALGAHMRRVVPDAMLGRASTLLALVSVAAIPLMQIGFGAVLDFGARAGFGAGAQYRMAFGCLGAMIFACGLVYATARNADEESV
jgi:MFS family permease